MALTNAYASVADLREHMGDTSSRMDTDVLERALNTAARDIDNYCSGSVPGTRRFWRDALATTRVFRCDHPTRAWVTDISTTTGLVIKTDPAGDGSFGQTWTAGVHYQLEPLNQDVVAVGDTVTAYAWWEIVAVGSLNFPIFVNQRVGLSVTARFGWSAIPAGVHSASLLQAAGLTQRGDAPFGVQGFDGFGVRIAQIDPTAAQLLTPFRKRRSRTLPFNAQAGSLFHWRSAGV